MACSGWRRLSDLGSACCLAVPLEDTVVTTLEYAPPEVLQSLPKLRYGNRSRGRSAYGGPEWYTPASDIWAAGVTLAELLSEQPWELQVRVRRPDSGLRDDAEEVEAYMAAIRTLRAEMGTALSEANITGMDSRGIALAQDMLQVSASIRCSAEEALARWFEAPAASTTALTAHRSAGRDHIVEVARVVARAYVLFSGIRGGQPGKRFGARAGARELVIQLALN